MAQAVVTMLILIIVVAYAVFFATWNPEVVRVVSLRFSGQDLVGEVPLWMLPLAGLALGAIVMAFVMWTPWSSMKRMLIATRERLGAEQARNKDLTARLKACRERLKQAGATAGTATSEEDAGETAEDT